MFELIGRPFDSTGLDRLLMGLPMALKGDIGSFLPLLAEQLEDRTGGIKDGVEQIKSAIKRKKTKEGGTQ
jgi:hypothetical protein